MIQNKKIKSSKNRNLDILLLLLVLLSKLFHIPASLVMQMSLRSVARLVAQTENKK